MTDQRGVVHEYDYDGWGRVTSDAVTGTVPVGVNSDVLRIETSYTNWGQVEKVTSYDVATSPTSSDIVNQIEYAYDDWGNVTDVWQDHDGEVNNGDDVGADSPLVEYGYDSNGRLTTMTYPTTSVVGYSYGSGMDDKLSRVVEINDNGGNPYAAYTYVGADLLVKSTRPSVTSDSNTAGDLRLSYGTSGDNYDGLDNFNRVVSQLWVDNDADPADVVDHYGYGYDDVGNRTYRENIHAGAQGTPVDLDELYTYDEIYRLIGSKRGGLNGAKDDITTTNFTQDWTLDGLGNWEGFGENADGIGTNDFDQVREVNEANEISAFTGNSNWIEPEFDDAGNMTSGPRPGSETVEQHYEYDAWNRLVEVTDDNSNSLVTYEYDGLNRRIEKRVTAAGGGVKNVDYYYNENWQLIEEAVHNGSDVLQSTNQYVWDVSYIDAPIARLHDGDANSTFTGTGDDENRYYTFDANQNITAAINGANGSVIERYGYDAYGQATVYDANWANGTAPTEDGVLYAGYFFDAESELYHVRNRNYDAALGQFIQRDPIGYSAGDSNLRRYVGNSPVNAVDPMGLDELFLHRTYSTGPHNHPLWAYFNLTRQYLNKSADFYWRVRSDSRSNSLGYIQLGTATLPNTIPVKVSDDVWNYTLLAKYTTPPNSDRIGYRQLTRAITAVNNVVGPGGLASFTQAEKDSIIKEMIARSMANNLDVEVATGVGKVAAWLRKHPNAKYGMEPVPAGVHSGVQGQAPVIQSVIESICSNDKRIEVEITRDGAKLFSDVMASMLINQSTQSNAGGVSVPDSTTASTRPKSRVVESGRDYVTNKTGARHSRGMNKSGAVVDAAVKAGDVVNEALRGLNTVTFVGEVKESGTYWHFKGVWPDAQRNLMYGSNYTFDPGSLGGGIGATYILREWLNIEQQFTTVEGWD